MGGDGGEKQTDVTNGGDDERNGGADGAVGVADGGMFLQNSQARWGEGGRLNANCSQICPAPLGIQWSLLEFPKFVQEPWFP